MVSICIPLYNEDVTILVSSLERQLSGIDVPIEIVMIDDASVMKFRDLNKKFGAMHRYIQLDKNIGRSAIRNLFLQYVNFGHLLFLDCDVKIMSDNFLQLYIDAIRRNPDAGRV